METYENLLNDAYKKVKPVESKIGRFEVPKIEGRLEGTKTIVTNIHQVASYLRRKPEHLVKYLLRELATSGAIKGQNLIMQRKVPSSKINEKVDSYIKEFVICKECKKPDTELQKQDAFMFLNCLACGAKHSVRAKF